MPSQKVTKNTGRFSARAPEGALRPWRLLPLFCTILSASLGCSTSSPEGRLLGDAEVDAETSPADTRDGSTTHDGSTPLADASIASDAGDASLAEDAGDMADAAACSADHYLSGTACVPLTQCQIEEYESAPPGSDHDRSCTALTACTSGQFESTPPTATSDRVCMATPACTTCAAGLVCEATACLPCSGTPCPLNKPFCDGATTHLCQPCLVNPGICQGSKPYCNDDGSCGAAPTSSAACARKSSQAPVLIGGACGCDANTHCDHQLKCDTATHACLKACTTNASTACATSDLYCTTGSECAAKKSSGSVCTVSTQCTSNHCECANNDCSQRKCSESACPVCHLTSGASCDLFVGANYASGCASGTVCNGSGACEKATGIACSADGECVSDHCVCADAKCTTRVCGAQACSDCLFSSNSGASCGAPIDSLVTHGACTITMACDGSGGCKKTFGTACTVASECIDKYCIHKGAVSDAQVCSYLGCGPCGYFVGNTCQVRAAGATCNGGTCDGTSSSVCH